MKYNNLQYIQTMIKTYNYKNLQLKINKISNLKMRYIWIKKIY